MSNDGGLPTSTSAWSGLVRVVRRSGMPVAWVVTLGVCAGSAFAVRDVVFPSLSPSAAPSLWQPVSSDPQSPSGGGTTVPDRIDVVPADVGVVVVTVPEASTESSSVDDTAGGSSTGVGAVTNRLPGHGHPVNTSPSPASSPGTTAPGDDRHPGTTVPKSTTTTAPDTSTSASPTTNPGTSDTLPDDTGGGSGSGRGGSSNDTLP